MGTLYILHYVYFQVLPPVVQSKIYRSMSSLCTAIISLLLLFAYMQPLSSVNYVLYCIFKKAIKYTYFESTLCSNIVHKQNLQHMIMIAEVPD